MVLLAGKKSPPFIRDRLNAFLHPQSRNYLNTFDGVAIWDWRPPDAVQRPPDSAPARLLSGGQEMKGRRQPLVDRPGIPTTG